jgi:hypothetical protein
VTTLVGDASEGVTLAHDVCHEPTGMAVALAARRGAAAPARYELVLYGDAVASAPPGGVRVALDGGALARKVAAARAYRQLAQSRR